MGLDGNLRQGRLPRDARRALVDGEMKAFAREAASAGVIFLQGRGAGPAAAASAVLADLVRAARDIPASAGALLASLADQPVATITPLGLQTPFPAVP